MFSITNNGDRNKVLTTVVLAIYSFFEVHHDAVLHFTGSNKARTRLYRIILTKYREQFSEGFKFIGMRDGKLEPFESNQNFDAFLVASKENKLFKK